MCRTAPSSKFATLFYGHWDGGTRTLTWANAGHNPVLLLRHGAAHVEQLGATGLVVGVVEDAHYEQVVSRLEPGDLLVLYTDGITEAENERGEFFGEQRLSALVEAYGDAGVDELRELILAEVERFSSDAPQHDDITLVLARVV
jgi:sigma-B regulation protein RsbU (phosphoserine phosphatase)